MCFIFKLNVVLLIFYLKLNGLNAIPLIDRNKIDISDNDNANVQNMPTTTTTPPPLITSTIFNQLQTAVILYNGSIANHYVNNNSHHNINNSNNNNNNIHNNINNINNNNMSNINDNYKYHIISAGNDEIKHPDRIDDNSNMAMPLIEKNSNNFYDEKYMHMHNDRIVKDHNNINKNDDAMMTLQNNPINNVLMDNTNILRYSFNQIDMDMFLEQYHNDDEYKCILDDIKDYFMWWSHTNGSLKMVNLNATKRAKNYLDLSYHHIMHDDRLYIKSLALSFIYGKNIMAFSAAYNNLTLVPYRTLSLMANTLQYLTLKGNHFRAYLEDDGHRNNMENDDHSNMDNGGENINKIFGNKDEGIAWAIFPLLPQLHELDLSDCHIEHIAKNVFCNLTNLQRLYMSHNKILTIPSESFHYVPHLQLLDLSFTNIMDYVYYHHGMQWPSLEIILNMIYGVRIEQNTFRYLSKLEYIDLSHTKLTRNSAMAFTHMGESVKWLSLCYTAFPMLSNALFKHTTLMGLDLSGNPSAANNIIDDAFEGVASTLEYLYFEHSNIKNLSWVHCLAQLRVLGLSGNNINAISADIFHVLGNLQILDLSSNHVGNWYNRAFAHNQQLRALNMRDNNINIINLEMLKDFQSLKYLSLGQNNFVCDCLLRELIDIAAVNNQKVECSHNELHQTDDDDDDDDADDKVKHFQNRLIWKRHLAKLEMSYNNMKQYKVKSIKKMKKLKLKFFSPSMRSYTTSPDANILCPSAAPELFTTHYNNKSNTTKTPVTLKFQLLDYEEEQYWCFNDTQRMHFLQLNCKASNYSNDGDIVDANGDGDDDDDGVFAEKLQTLTKYVIGCVVGILILILLGVVLYMKRWHIHYYYTSLKSAALVSVATKNSIDKFNRLAEDEPNHLYDIFISYCQDDRQWILDELLPNVEEAGDISICMHERDFQIGVTILDNIISCMDRSRALMLIISRNFLLSHWCQFEMHLAQHRIFEVSREHLIIVFLEDIPRNKRPKSLQYLMEVKTYIKWPAAKGENQQIKAEERKFFWKRLKRSLHTIGLNQT